MNRYRSGMVQLAKLFPKLWPIMCTTDVVLRSERWGRLREQIEASLAMGAPVMGHDPARPWDVVIAQSAYGREGLNATWWQSHFILPCMLSPSVAGASNTIQEVEGYSNTATSSHSSQSNTRAKRQLPQPLKPPAPPAANPGEICMNFNSRSGRCAKDGVACWANRAHKCDVCGGNHRGIDVHTAAGEKYHKREKRWNPDGGNGDNKRKKPRKV